jgi:ADP-ribose pyrophosphatase YjhB (NUDIX family)
MPYRQLFDHYNAPAHDLSAELPAFRYCPFCGAALPRPTPYTLHCSACGRRLFRNPDPGTVVLLEQDERLLLGRRAAGYGAGMWGLPGGFVEYPEDFLSGARREVLEETGLRVRIDAIVNVTSNLLRPELHTLAVVLLAHPTPDAGSPAPGDDLDRLAWFGRDDPLPPLAFEADAHIIAVWRRRELARIPVETE